MNNIIFIGMPGVGKSTIGVVLAKRLGMQFIDSDLKIQEVEKKLLHEIISEKGLDGFLEVENQVNAALEVENCIIATGGSAVFGKEAMDHFAEIGVIIYLSLPYDKMTNIGMLLPFLYEESREGYNAGKSPEEISQKFNQILQENPEEAKIAIEALKEEAEKEESE